MVDYFLMLDQHMNVVPVVRCKDCIHWDERQGRKYCYCMYFDQDDPDFYCGYAERRTENG